MNIIKPQEGYQIKALSSPADILIGGGAAGVGKTFTLLLEPLRHVNKRDFGAVIFRRTSPMIRAEGGLWDASTSLYTIFPNIIHRETKLEWEFQSGCKIKFSHLEHEKNIYDWQGTEIPLIGFDELTHFSKKMFFYLLSRNRSTSGIKPYVRATCNPDPDSWVRDFIDWWIDQDGYPIPERSGVLRYFMVDSDNYIWGDSKDEVVEKGWHILQPMIEKSGIDSSHFVKSLTFIGGSIYDNKELLKIDPAYLGNLNAQSDTDKSRLLYGNWNIKLAGDDIYNAHKFNDIFTNTYCENLYRNAPKRITCDVALKGSDKLVIFVWKGKMLIDFIILDKSKGNEVVDAIRNMAYKHMVQFSNISFDNDGVGQFVDGFIEDSREFNNNARPLNGEAYKNLKSQCYLRSGDAVQRGEYYIPEHIANRPYNDQYTLKEQLKRERKAIKRGHPDNDNKLCVIPKQEMKVFLDGKSPDLMDTFMQLEYFYVEDFEPKVEYM